MAGLLGGFALNSYAIAFGWTLVHFLWQGAALAGVFVVLDWLFRKRAANARYAVALSVLLFMPIVVSLTYVSEYSQLHPTSAVRMVGENAHKHDNYDQASPLTSNETPALKGVKESIDNVLPWLDLAWIFGACLFLIRAILGWLHLRTIWTHASISVPIQVERAFRVASNKLRATGQVMLRVSDQAISPFAMGLWRKTVILPTGALLGLSAEDLELILIHEIAHLRRWDYLVNLLQVALETLLFFHPAVWWVSNNAREYRETCCDAMAAEMTDDRATYAKALLHLEELRAVSLQLSLPLTGQPGTLLRRVRAVLGGSYERTHVVRSAYSMCSITLLLIITGGMFLSGQHEVAASENATTATQPLKSEKSVGLALQGNAPSVSERPQVSEESTESSAIQPGALQALNEQVSVPSPVVDLQANAVSDLSNYIESMQKAGYNMASPGELKQVTEARVMGVTPQYADEVDSAGLGRVSLHDLAALKSVGITVAYLDRLKRNGLAPASVREALELKLYAVDGRYRKELESLGYAGLNEERLVELKALKVDHAYASWLRRQFPEATTDDLRMAALLHLDDQTMRRLNKQQIVTQDLKTLLNALALKDIARN